MTRDQMIAHLVLHGWELTSNTLYSIRRDDDVIFAVEPMYRLRTKDVQ